MKMKQHTLIVFTIAFMFLIPSLSGVLIIPETHTQEEQKPMRDNALAEETEGTDTVFNKFPSDTLYYPDAMMAEPLFATDGDSGYNNTYAIDGIYFPVTLGTEILEFHVDNNSITGIEYFSYAVYGSSSDETSLYYDDADDPPWTDTFTTLDEPTLEWYNGTEYDVSVLSNIIASETFYIYFDFTSNIDYIEITFAYMTLSSKTDSLTDPLFATDGDSGYDNTYAIDGSYFPVTLGTELLQFDYISEYPIEYFSYAVYGSSSDETHLYYDDADDPPWTDTFTTLDEPTLEWYNGTEYDVSVLSNIETSKTFYIYFDFASNIDYIEITFCYLSLGENSYADSFAGVDDWNAINDPITTDNDTATISTSSDNTWDRYDWNLPSRDLQGYYLEIRVKLSAYADAHLYVVTKTADDYLGDTIEAFYFIHADISHTNWATYKVRLANSGVVECISILVKSASANIEYEMDYFRVSTLDETGYQHDGSTIAGTDATSSDGDLITVTSSIIFDIDATDTATLIDTDYYSFLDVLIDDGSGNILIEASADGIAWHTIVTTTPIIADTHYRGNVLTTGIEVKEIRVNISSWATLDFCQLYSITNYTVTESSTTTDDYLYISEGVLYSHMDSGSIILDFDPTFLLNGSYTWNKSTSLGTSYLSFYHGGWTSYSAETTGDLVLCTTDYRIMFNATANIIDILFSPTPPQWHSFTMEQIEFDLPSWQSFVMEVIVFFIPINELNITYLLMLGGMVMVPTSTILLVKGGRSDLSRDKLFLFFLMFLFGWALLLGGIL